MPLSKITRLRGGTNNSGPATLAMQGASGDGAGFVHTEVFGIAGIAAATEITRATGTGANGFRMLIDVTATGHTGRKTTPTILANIIGTAGRTLSR